MTPEQWQRIEELFVAALEQEPADRYDFLARVCSGDRELQHQVEDLIASHERTGSFLETPLRSEALQLIAEQHSTGDLRSTFLPDDVVLNRYKVLRSLGRGGMGEVYAVQDLDLDRPVALKTIRLGTEQDPEALYRFKHEFRALADLHHPNLVKLYDLLSDGQHWLFTMELVDGIPFLQYVRPEDNLDEMRLRQVLPQLAQGIEALHRAGKLHLDIKPSNVLVTKDGAVRLIDFGLVTEVLPSDQTQTVSLIGTPAYMAPEQGGAGPISEASDWYSVGTMIYEALMGRLPFLGSPFEIYRRKCEDTLPAPSTTRSGLPEHLSTLCMELLHRDPACRPSGTEVLRRVAEKPEAQDRGLQVKVEELREPLFVGRELELRALDQAHLESRSGRAVVVCIAGASGIGKTALIRRFLHIVERNREGSVLLVGRCYERESVPFKAIDSVVDSLSTYLKRLPAVSVAALLPCDVHALVRLFPVLRQVETIASAPAPISIPDPQEMRRRAFAALRELLARLYDRGPLVICNDDMQWADADSFSLLSEVIGSGNAPSALVILSHREEETDTSKDFESLLSLASATGTVRHLHLGELSHQDSCRLAAGLLGIEGSQESLLEGIAREAGGIPFFIDQLAQFGRAGTAHTSADPVPAEPTPATTLPSLAKLMTTRIQSLPTPASSLLDIVALAGQPLRLDQLKGAAVFDIHDDAALPTLRAVKLIRTRQKHNQLELEMYHDRIRESVVDRIPPEARRKYHLALAVSLEKCTEPDSESLAHHFEAAGETRKAASYAEVAADRAAAALAFDRAARLYGMALKLSPESGSQPRKLRIGMAEALAKAARGPEAADQYLQAARESSGNEALQLQQRGAEQFLRSGYLEEGITLLRRVSAALGLRLATSRRALFPSLLLRRTQLWLRRLRYREREPQLVDPDELLRIDVCWSLALGWSTIDSLRGAEAQALHLLLALRCGEPRRVALALAGEAGYATVRSNRSLRRVPQLLDLAMQTATRSDHPHALGLATFSAAMQSWVHGDYLQAFRLCERAEEIYVRRCKGVAWERETVQIFALACLAWMGRLKEFSERLPPLLAEAEKRGDRYAAASLIVLTCRWLALLANDDPERAEREITAAMRDWPSDGYHLQHFFSLLGRFEIALYRGQPEFAVELVGKQWRAIRRSLLLTNAGGRFFAAHLRARSLLAAASVLHSSPPSCNRLLRDAEREIQKIGGQGMLPSVPMAELLRAGSALIRGNSDEAVTLYSSAEKGFESVNMQLYASVARRRHGELTSGDEGRALIASADSWMQSQGVKNPTRFAATLAPAL